MIRRIKIFISSPNDLKAEREICRKVIDELNLTLPKDRESGIWLDSYFWEERPEVIGMGKPQGRIDSPADYDLFIGMYGKRYGTPTGAIDPETNEPYKSGTEQEFKEAYRGWKETGGKRPEIKFMHKKVEEELFVEGTEEYEQYRRVDAFLKDFLVGGKHPGLYFEFSDLIVLEKAVRKIIEDYCEQHKNSHRLGRHYSQEGLVSLFIPTEKDSAARNEDKKRAIQESEKIRLIAHCGYSYLFEERGLFYRDLFKLLERGGEVEIILANPYSEMGYYITAGNVPRGLMNGKDLVGYLKEKNSAEHIACIEGSSWVSAKRAPAIKGYEILRRTFGDRIKLKVCSYEMSSTILVTEKIAFIEPYLHCVGEEKGMNAFELCVERIPNKETAYNVLCEYFDFLWAISEEHESFDAKVHKKKLRNDMKRLDLLFGMGTLKK